LVVVWVSTGERCGGPGFKWDGEISMGEISPAVDEDPIIRGGKL
jgi:hypothetical protein